MPKHSIKDDYLAPEVRAQDILLGAAGFGEEGCLIKVERQGKGYIGQVKFSDGEVATFQSEEPISELERWALSVLLPG